VGVWYQHCVQTIGFCVVVCEVHLPRSVVRVGILATWRVGPRSRPVVPSATTAAPTSVVRRGGPSGVVSTAVPSSVTAVIAIPTAAAVTATPALVAIGWLSHVDAWRGSV